MKRIVLIVCAVALLAVLSGCVTAGMDGCEKPSSIPDYPTLTRSFDTSARFSVYGVNGEQRNGLVAVLRLAGYADADAVAPGVSSPIVMPDRIVDIVAVNYKTESLNWLMLTCKATFRVRKPMKTTPGGVPVVDEGKTIDVWAQSRIMDNGEYVVENGIPRYGYPKLEKSLFAQVCANLMNVEAFRLALELK